MEMFAEIGFGIVSQFIHSSKVPISRFKVDPFRTLWRKCDILNRVSAAVSEPIFVRVKA
jgi:hypothetical protein